MASLHSFKTCQEDGNLHLVHCVLKFILDISLSFVMPNVRENILESTLMTGIKKVLPLSWLFISCKILVHCFVF